MTNSTRFFFIDEQGTLNNDQKWLLRGGFLIDVHEYLKLNRRIKKLNKESFDGISEIKWSHISIAIYLKRNKKKLSPELCYLEKFSIEQLETYLDYFFKIIAEFDIKVIINISEKVEVNKFIKKQDSFVKMQLQNLMQRCQYAGQDEKFVTILVHENENTSKDDKIKKDVYKEIINSDSFIKDYNLIVDNLFIEFSNLNIGIQISDFIIGAVSATLRGYETSANLYKKYLKSKIRTNKKDGSFIGYGVVTIPNPKTSPVMAQKIESILN